MYDVEKVRADFPILARQVNGKPLVYLDNGASAQKPQVVIDAVTQAYSMEYANVHRGLHYLSNLATDKYEAVRGTIARFLNATHEDEIVFTSGTTEGINLISYGWAAPRMGPGDEIVLSVLEHHANIVPWQMLVAERGIELRWIPLTADGELDLSNLGALLDGAKALSFTAMSNVLGTITPVAALCRAAHDAGAVAIVDACQYVPHNVTDVRAWDADFVTFSSHKMVGPSGIGVMWGREALLDAMPPFLGGGNMIADVRLDGFTCAGLPAKFEAGTPPIVEAVGLGAAVDYLSGIGMANVRRHEMGLTSYALDTLTSRYGDDITIHGPRNPHVRGAVLSFAFRGIHPHDVSQVLDEKNVCVRAGHHCAKPLMKLLGANATARASFYLYNDTFDVDALAESLDSATDIFGF